MTPPRTAPGTVAHDGAGTRGIVRRAVYHPSRNGVPAWEALYVEWRPLLEPVTEGAPHGNDSTETTDPSHL